MADNLVKIAFCFHSDLLDEWTVETMWAEPIDEKKGLYKLDNIPFYAPVASDDIVFAEYDETEQRLMYRETVTYSGNSIIQVIIMKDGIETNDVRNIFETLGCPSEKANDKYFALEIPANISYEPIKAKLTEMFKDGVLDYAEPYLSANHSY